MKQVKDFLADEENHAGYLHTNLRLRYVCGTYGYPAGISHIFLSVPCLKCRTSARDPTHARVV